jgi:hypothetical protein
MQHTRTHTSYKQACFWFVLLDEFSILTSNSEFSFQNKFEITNFDFVVPNILLSLSKLYAIEL